MTKRSLPFIVCAGAALVVVPASSACGYDTLGDMGLFLPDDAASGDAPPDIRDDAVASNSDGTAPDGSPPSEGGPGTSTTELRCGVSTCSIPGQSCCVDFSQGPPQELSFACVNGSDCPAPDSGPTAGQPGVSLKCQGAANCQAGTVCCISKIQNTVFARCTPVCGTGEAQLCEPNATAPGCSNVSGSCSSANVESWGLPSSYGTCGGVGAQ